MNNSLALDGGGHPFFYSKSFRVALSSMASANSFFRRAFSLSSARKRLASDYAQTPVLGLPTVKGRAADPMLAANIGRLRPGLLLPQDRNDLLFRMPRSLHRPVLPSRPDSSSTWIKRRG